MKGQKLNLYVNKLDFAAGAKIFWVSLFNRVENIYYLSLKKRSTIWITLIQRLKLCSTIDELTLDYTEQIFKGGALWDWVQLTVENCTQEIINKLTAQGILFSDLLPGVDPTRLEAFLRKTIQIQIYYPVSLGLAAANQYQESSSKPGLVILGDYSDLAPVLEVVLRDIAEIDVRMLGYSSLAENWFVQIGWFFIEQFRNIIGRLLTRRNQSQTSHPPSVAIVSAWRLEELRRGINSVWWFSNSGIPNQNCFIGFMRSSAPVTDETIDFIHQHKYRFRILKRYANETSDQPTKGFPPSGLIQTFQDSIRFIKLLVKSFKIQAPKWQLATSITTLVHARRWQALMIAENIKVIDHYEECGLDTISLAADLVGAIRIGYHWSDLHIPDALVLFLHQVYFVWGKRAEAIVRSSLAGHIDHVIQSGSVFHNAATIQDFAEKARDIRAELEGQGIKHFVGIFDRSFSRTSHYPPEKHVQFYKGLFDWVKQHPEIGLIIKPKQPMPPVLKSYPALAEQLHQLEKTGQALLLDGKRSVIEAAKASDVVVSLGYNSAGVLAALTGARSIFWDAAAMKLGPLRDRIQELGLNNSKVVFHEMDELLKAIWLFFDDPQRHGELGDLSQEIVLTDPYRDDKAALRLGSFAWDFIQASDQGLTREQALNQAKTKYQDAWGQSKHENKNKLEI